MGLFDLFKKKASKNMVEEKSVSSSSKEAIATEDKIEIPEMETKEKSAINKPKKEKPKFETVKVHGSSFRQQAFKQLNWEDNPYYDYKKSELIDAFMTGERIYEYYYNGDNKVELIDEPDNPEDPNAIAIYLDGVQIGYVAKGKTAHIRKLRKTDNIGKLSIEVWGGKYKYLREYEDEDYETKYDLEKETQDYGAQITLYYKNTGDSV